MNDPYNCEHIFDPPTMICELCGITAEAAVAGRDKPATWEDVDEAYKDGYNLGIEIGKATYKQLRRLKLIEVGYYLCIRTLRNTSPEENRDRNS